MTIVNLPIPETASAEELLASCSRRDFSDVLVLGYDSLGELRHGGTMTTGQKLHLIETYKLILLGVIEGASRDAGE